MSLFRTLVIGPHLQHPRLQSEALKVGVTKETYQSQCQNDSERTSPRRERDLADHILLLRLAPCLPRRAPPEALRLFVGAHLSVHYVEINDLTDLHVALRFRPHANIGADVRDLDQ